MAIPFLLMAIAGLIIFSNKNYFVDFIERINRYKIPRNIHMIRIIIASSMLILFGFIGIIIELLK